MLRADISQCHAIKSVFEEIFGNEVWLELKECTSLTTWKKYTSALFRAVQLAIEETVKVRDDAWFEEISDSLEHGLRTTKSAKSIDELLSALSASLARVVFLQIGMFPNRRRCKRVTLARDNWRLNTIRTVQYTQTMEQLERLFWSKQQSALGAERQMDLWGQYRRSKSKMRYSEWCNERKT